MFSSSKPKDLPGVPRDVQRVYNLLTPKPKELLQHVSNRRFIREGEVGMYNHKEKRTKRRYLFLFNDVLLITKREGKTSYWLKIFISLRSNLTVEDVPDSTTKHKVEFRIYAPKKTIILFTHTEEEKIVWLKDIKNALAGNYTEKKERFSSSSSDFDQPKQIVISGDIGTIEIPGIDTSTGLSNQAKRLSGERSDFGFEDDFIQYSSKSKLQGPTPIPEFEFAPTPATPTSTPVQPSILDEFESLANRSTTSSVPSFGGAQPTTFASTTTFPTQLSFNSSNSAPLPATTNPSANFQNLLQPTATSPAVQPTFQSTNLLSPTVLQPTLTGVLQPTPSNPAPAPLQSGDFSALRSLNQQPQQPQQTAGQLFTSIQPQPAQPQSPFASLNQPQTQQFSLLGQPSTQPFGQPTTQTFGQPTTQPFGQPVTQPFGSQAYGQQPFGQPAGNTAFVPNYQMQMQQFQQLQQMQQMQQLQAQQRMFGGN